MNMVSKSFVSAQFKALALREAIASKLQKKAAGDAAIVTSCIIIVIALILCIVYKNAITNSINMIITRLNAQINNLYDSVGG